MANKPHSLAHQRRVLEQRIQHNRRQLRDANDEWLNATASFDQAASRLMYFKKPILLVGGVVLARYLKRSPHKLVRVARKGIGLYALVRNVRRLL